MLKVLKPITIYYIYLKNVYLFGSFTNFYFFKLQGLHFFHFFNYFFLVKVSKCFGIISCILLLFFYRNVFFVIISIMTLTQLLRWSFANILEGVQMFWNVLIWASKSKRSVDIFPKCYIFLEIFGKMLNSPQILKCTINFFNLSNEWIFKDCWIVPKYFGLSQFFITK